VSLHSIMQDDIIKLVSKIDESVASEFTQEHFLNSVILTMDKGKYLDQMQKGILEQMFSLMNKKLLNSNEFTIEAKIGDYLYTISKIDDSKYKKGYYFPFFSIPEDSGKSFEYKPKKIKNFDKEKLYFPEGIYKNFCIKDKKIFIKNLYITPLLQSEESESPDQSKTSC
ncbi:MAG: hypothetical protein RMM53_06955, partial [Bacteroidia bacterium]|nr:hypothetical protein [Bacteroidia bacterium]